VTGVILAMLDHPESAADVLTATGRLAEMAGGARVNVLTARMPPISTILPGEEVLTRDKEARLRAVEDTRVAALKASFDAWAANGRHAEFVDIEADTAGLIVSWGRRADLIVLERPGPRQYGATWQALPAALFDTDRPVAIIPPGPATAFGRHIAIAWRDDPHATRAVLSALRYASEAESVHLLAGVRPFAPEPRIPDILLEHGIAADLQTIPLGKDPFGLALLAKAHAIGADMLVMGAYAHSPWRQVVLGGTTRSIIAHADIPVLMRH
jgi:nucleotide-binding universal stress UspA family protein